MSLPYNRALHPDDYRHPLLAPAVQEVVGWQRALNEVQAPYRADHEHRQWEYANVVRQLRELGVPPEARILDTGSGASYNGPGLVLSGFIETEVSDSCEYGDPQPWIQTQASRLGLRLPFHVAPIEQLPFADQTYDVTLCISTIEHLEASLMQRGLAELVRVTKVGGYVMVTTDYFRDLAAWEASPFRQIQHTCFTPETLPPLLHSLPGTGLIGEEEWAYRGDFVNNYSFANACLQRQF